MPNLYANVKLFRSTAVLNSELRDTLGRHEQILEAASRDVDRYCGRHFYESKATRHFDGSGTDVLWVSDLISIDANGLNTDENGDGTFEQAWVATDYRLLPYNAAPTSRFDPESSPYYKIWADPNGTRKTFPSGSRLVQIAGSWGYWRHLKRATETANAIADATVTTITLSSQQDVQPGHTLLIDSEQIYVKGDDNSPVFSVERGVNGTTAASHSSGAVIDIYEYPAPVVEATIYLATISWMRMGAGYAHSIIGSDGSMRSFGAPDKDVARWLDGFRLVHVS